MITFQLHFFKEWKHKLLWFDRYTSHTKSSNVQHSNVVTGSFKGDWFVDALNNVVKQITINSFGKSISCIVGFIHLQWNPGNKQEITQYIPKLRKKNNIKIKIYFSNAYKICMSYRHTFQTEAKDKLQVDSYSYHMSICTILPPF